MLKSHSLFFQDSVSLLMYILLLPAHLHCESVRAAQIVHILSEALTAAAIVFVVQAENAM